MQIGKLRLRGFSSKAIRVLVCSFCPRLLIRPFQNLFLWSDRVLFSHILDIDGADMQSSTGAMLVRETDLFILMSPTLGTMPEARKGLLIIP